MKAEYRFLRTHNGITSFANVELEASISDGLMADIAEDLPLVPKKDDGEVNRKTAPDWIDAAISGINDGVAFAQASGVTLKGWHFRLVRVFGTPVDTGDDAVRCAATLATLQLISQKNSVPATKVLFDDGRWSVHYPLATAGARQGLAS